jgi:hypothetical protein
MAISKCIRYWFILTTVLFSSCDSYETSNRAFEEIILKNNSQQITIKKAELLKYKKGTNFKIVESKSSDFDITKSTVNDDVYLTAKFDNDGKISSDLVLFINDTMEFKISEINTVRDTLKRSFTMSRQYYISNKIKSFKVNGKNVDNDDRSIVLNLNDAVINRK